MNNTQQHPVDIVEYIARNIIYFNEIMEKEWGLPDHKIDHILMSHEFEDRLKNDPQILHHERHATDEGFMAKVYGLTFRSSMLPPAGHALLCNYRGVPIYLVSPQGDLQELPKGVFEPPKHKFKWEN